MDLTELGPLSIFICWQSLAMALVITLMTHGVKRAVDVILGGAEVRKNKAWIQQLLLPATPIIFGVVLAIVVPLRPEALDTYITEKAFKGPHLFGVLAVYGACLGQFADYIWSRISATVDGFTRKTLAGLSSSTTEAEKPPETPPT